ncbi:site-2 protease family protein [Pseudonocardia sp. HH130630-07]|uniref:site-2 protease family protein n=1 Tax=Pseudonocardia sp. HH130630-07 TaxID=1690815 RepID=UPI000814BDEC|nr:site-2 protease family protein [Pseudonocardia sp. HH130630-07]ANY07576.1 peptidase M50 [Pseudonocardia sp. HH130630-07]
MPALARRISPWFLLLVGITALGGVLAAVAVPAGSDALAIAGVFVIVLGGWTVSLCLHEYGHAITAYRGGDTSVALKGYLTLDIRRYTDPGLSLVLPLIILLIGGLPLPGGAVWINQWALRSRGWRSAVSLAGPAANLVVGIVLIVTVAVFTSMPPPLAAGLSALALFQIVAVVLNLLPVPGLDGWGAIEPFLSVPAQRFGAKVRPWAPLALLGVLLFVPGISTLFFAATQLLYSLVGGDSQLAGQGFSALFFWRYL